jgi:predicted RNase H-like nuclease (RuvC/YqgF family)
MSEGLMIAIITALATILTVGITQGVAYLIARSKKTSKNIKYEADASLSRGDLAEKYQKIASTQADENIRLNKEIDKKEGENENLMSQISELRHDMEAMDKKHTIDIENMKIAHEQEIGELRCEFEKWKSWATRLNMQLMSWQIIPVPFDLDKAKESGLALGEFGKFPLEISKGD